MKNLHAEILAACMGALGSMAALAQNTAYGTDALANDTTGIDNAAFGSMTLDLNRFGDFNSAFGYNALNTNGFSGNTASGYGALTGNDGNANTAIGIGTIDQNEDGNYNSAVGSAALELNDTSSNTALGSSALGLSTAGEYNVAIGNGALVDNKTGGDNVATGASALLDNRGGSNNTAVGFASLEGADDDSNIGIGFEAGFDVTDGTSDNIDIGNEGSGDNAIYIGTPGTQTSFIAAGVDGVSVSGGVPVYINSSGQLGTANSSIRFKEDVHDMGDASNAIFRLRPVTYRYKQPYADGSKPIDYGLIAEEVANIYPDMVVKDADGQIQTVQYQKLTPMLLNEIQEQQRLLEKRQAMIQQMEKELATLPLLEKRLAALEAASSSAVRLESRFETK